MKTTPFFSELFVINSIKNAHKVTTFKPALSAVADEILAESLPQVLKILQNERRLKEAIEDIEKVKEDDLIFDHLRKVIFRSFEQKSLSHSQFTLQHVERLLDADVHQRLAGKGFGDSQDNALQDLLNVPQLKETLKYLTGEREIVSNEALKLLTDILKPNHITTLQRDNNTTNWKTIFEEEEWLTEHSIQLLNELERSNNENFQPFEVLAKLVDDNQTEEHENFQENDQLNILDSLTLLVLHRHILWIVNKLQDQSIDYVENAAKSLPDSPSLQLFLPILYLHGFGAIAKGINKYINYPKTLEDLLIGSNVEKFEAQEDKIHQHRPLVFTKMSVFEEDQQRKYGSFQIKYRLKGFLAPSQPLLIARRVPIGIYRQLEKDIPKLTPNDLNIIGENLPQRLLNTFFPLLDPKEKLLKEAINQLGSTFIQAIALTFENPLEIIPEKIWAQQIEPYFSYQDLPIHAETSYFYPKGVEDIKHELENEYQKKIKFFKGTDPTQLESAS